MSDGTRGSLQTTIPAAMEIGDFIASMKGVKNGRISMVRYCSRLTGYLRANLFFHL